MFRNLLLSSLFITLSTVISQAQSLGTGPSLVSGDFESGTLTYNPWAGVDDLGNLHVIPGSQLAVGETGSVSGQGFSPSVAVGDLNGDGLPDLVVADARGYFWFFPNSGKPDAPVFTHGEVIPIWIGKGDSYEGDAVPRMQLVDFTGDGKLSIVTGNYFGGLYYFRNGGSKASPNFRMLSHERTDYQFPTRTVDGKNLLWCNYLSPYLYDWTGTGRLDLIMGDGSYAANSIYYFNNMGNNDRPVFNEAHQQKLIPGMGREHLTPAVIDWNNDGKPDIICGERTGVINVYLNQAANKGDAPSFNMDTPQHVMFGTTEKIGALTTVCPADLNNDKLFDLAVGSSDGRIMYSLNTGTPGSPKFGAPVTFKGINQYPKISKPRGWGIDRYRTDGAAYELLEVTNATVEKDFVPPPAPFKGKGALKFSMVKPNNVYFPEPYIAPTEMHWVKSGSRLSLEAGVRYKLSFWVRMNGDIDGLTYRMEGRQSLSDETEWTDRNYTGQSMGGGSTWTRVDQEVEIPKVVTNNPKKLKEVGNFSFWLTFTGDGDLYLDDISLRKAE